MGLSRFGGLWTYANAAAIDVPRSDEDVVELTFEHSAELGGGYRASADGLTGGAVNVSLVGAGVFDVGDVITVRVYCDEDGESATIVDATVGLISI